MEGQPAPHHNFPRIPLSADAQVWLEAAYARLKAGRKIEPAEMLVELWGRVPEDFHYKAIDSRLLKFGVKLTLLGILHADPSADVVSETDRVIRHIRGLITKEFSLAKVTAGEVSEALGIPEEKVANIFDLMDDLGHFWNGASGHADLPGYNSITVKDEHVKRAYLSYKGIEHLLNKFYEENKPTPPDDSARISATTSSQPPATQDAKNVFVVHGRDLEARTSLFRFLRSIGLRPLEWSQAIKETGKASPFIGEILDVAFSKAQAVVVLLTPDDEARLREPFRGASEPAYETQLTGQARPNVLFEAGMAMGRNPDRTVIVELGSLRPFSDIAGRHTVRLSDDSAARQELAHRLETAGCAVDLSGRDWHVEGDFGPRPTGIQASGAPTPGVRGADGASYDKNDVISLIEAYIESKKPKFGGNIQIVYADVDREQGIRPGATKRHINAAVRALGYRVERKGNSLIVINTPPDPAVA